MSAERRTVAERLAQIAAAHRGRLEVDDVIADARPDDSPLHSHFEWDDGIAADEYRREQARELIRSVTLEIAEISPAEYNRTPAWVRDSRRPSGEQGYVATLSIQPNSEHARATMRAEVARVVAHWRRALAVSDAVGMRDEALAELHRAEAILERLTAEPAPAPRRSRRREERPAV